MRTLLLNSLTAYKKLVSGQEQALDIFKEAIAEVTGRRPLGNPNRQEHIEKEAAWEHPMATASLFGGEARSVFQVVESDTTKEVIRNVLAELFPHLETPHFRAMMNIDGTARGLKDIQSNLRGIGDAVWTSYAIGVNPESIAQMQESKDNNIKFAGYMSALAYTMAGVNVEQSKEAEDIIRATIPKLGRATVREAFMSWVGLFTEPDKKDKPNSEEGEEATQLINMAAKDVPPEPQNSATGYKIIEQPHVPLPPKSFNNYIEADSREKMNSQLSGIPLQLWRVTTDARCFTRKRKAKGEFAEMVGMGLDISGSMGYRIEKALEIHDSLAAMFTSLDIPFVNCAYKGHDRGNHPDEIVPLLNGSGREAAKNMGGNGDLGAVLWLTEEMSIARASSNVLIMIADGQFTNVTIDKMQREITNLRATVIHVNFVKGNPFGTDYLIDANADNALEQVFKALQDVLRL